MLEQVSTSVKFLAFYTASKQGKTGLTVTVDIYDPSGTQIVTDGSATAVGGGLYSYTLSSNNSSEGEYAAIFKTTDSTVDSQHIPSLWVLGRAGVENLDAATSTRAVAADIPTSDISAIKAATDNLPSDPADQSLLEAAISALSIPTVIDIRTEMDTNSAKLSNLDASISSRLAAVDFVAPANSDIAAIKSKTDSLPASPAAVSDIPTTAQIATAVEGSLLNEADGQSVLNAIVGAIGNTNVDEIALVAAIRSDLERSGGKLDNVPTAAANATAVWAASTKEITGGTVDTLVNAPSVPSASAIADEVRLELAAELSNLDAPVSGATAPDAASVATAVRSELSVELAHLDADISSRAVAGDIPASDIADIKAKTDLLNTDRLAQCSTVATTGAQLAAALS